MARGIVHGDSSIRLGVCGIDNLERQDVYNTLDTIPVAPRMIQWKWMAQCEDYG